MEIFDVLYPEQYIANKETGETKTKWHNVGTIMRGQKQDGTNYEFLKINAIPGFALPAVDDKGNPVSYLIRKREQVQKTAPTPATANPASSNNDYGNIPF